MDDWYKFQYSRLKTTLSDAISEGFLRVYGILEKILVLPLLALLLVTIYVAYLGLQAGNHGVVSAAATTAGSIGTIFLVGITIRYARQTREMAKSVKTNQMRDKILGVVEQIDTLIEILEDQKNHLDETHEGDENVGTTPDLRQFTSPYPLVSDIQAHYPAAAVLLDGYLETSDEYHSQFMELIDEVEEAIRLMEIPENLPGELVDVLPQDVDDDSLAIPWRKTDNPSIVVEEEARNLAWSVLTDHPSSLEDFDHGNIGRQQIAWFVYLNSRNEFLELRNHSELQDDYSSLTNLLDQLERQNDRVLDAVRWVRKRLLEEFGILESELSEIEISGTK